MTQPTLLILLTERETAAGLVVERLREQIATLTDQLAAAETEVAELAITRKTLLSLGGPLNAAAPADPTVASPAYQQILAVFHAAAAPMRAKDICQARWAPAPPRRTPRGSEPSSNASSPARSSPNPRPACSPSPLRRRPRNPHHQGL